jgi:hypothetical protein
LSPERPLPLAPPPLRYAGASQLLRRVRPRVPHRYSAPCGCCRLESSLSLSVTQQRYRDTRSHVPYESPDRTHAAYMPDTTWPINGHPPGSSRDRGVDLGFDVFYTVFDTSNGRGLASIAHLSGPIPDAIKPRLLPRRSARQSSANAPRGGLMPLPAERHRRARQPPSPRTAPPSVRPPSPMTHLRRSCSQHHNGLQPMRHEVA